MSESYDGIKTIGLILLPTVMVGGGLFIFRYPLDSLTSFYLSILLFLSLLLLLTGFLIHTKISKVLRAAGWIVFAFYWSTQINTLYYYEFGDLINASLCSVGVYLLVYFAYKDLTAEAVCITWLAGVAGLSGMIYFLMEYISMFKDLLIKIVTAHTALLYSIFDRNIRAEDNLIWAGYDYIQNSSPTAEIIFACTAVQSMLLFVGLILPLRGVEIKRRASAVMLLLPTIYLLNLIRNAIVIYLVGYRITDMNVAHNYIGKSGSLLALVVLVFLTFKYIPELYDRISCTINLYKEEGFLERTLKRLVR